MDNSNPRARIGGSRAGQLLATRRSALLVAGVAALLAGALFYLFVSHYKNSTSAAPVVNETVFVSHNYIPQGTASATIIAQGYLTRTVVPGNQAVAGAVTDPSEIANSVTSQSIAAGQQVSVVDFSRTNISFSAYLNGYQRAMELTVDQEHGLTAHIEPNDTVDIFSSSSVGPAKMLAKNITILDNSGGEVDIRVTDRQAIAIAQVQDSAAKIWMVLRPSVNVKSSVGTSVPVLGSN